MQEDNFQSDIEDKGGKHEQPPTYSIIISILSIVVSIIVAIAFIIQIIQLKKALHCDVVAKLQNHGLEILKLLGNNNNVFYKYFYEGKNIDSDKDKIKTKLLAEAMADFFEHIISQNRAIAESELLTEWISYMQSIYKNSPILKEFIDANESWFSEELKKTLIIEDFDKFLNDLKLNEEIQKNLKQAMKEFKDAIRKVTQEIDKEIKNLQKKLDKKSKNLKKELDIKIKNVLIKK